MFQLDHRPTCKCIQPVLPVLPLGWLSQQGKMQTSSTNLSGCSTAIVRASIFARGSVKTWGIAKALHDYCDSCRCGHLRCIFKSSISTTQRNNGCWSAVYAPKALGIARNAIIPNCFFDKSKSRGTSEWPVDLPLGDHHQAAARGVESYPSKKNRLPHQNRTGELRNMLVNGFRW